MVCVLSVMQGAAEQWANCVFVHRVQDKWASTACPVPPLQALMLHNQVIRDAAYANAGHVLAQEGDAFIVGFCDALDAAVFALQVIYRGRSGVDMGMYVSGVQGVGISRNNSG